MSTDKPIGEMTVKELAELIRGMENPDPMELGEVNDKLCSLAWQIAGLLDRTHGIDPDKGRPIAYGTRNRKSYTYKVRKAVGYSYP